MANMFDVYNNGSIIDHTEGEKLETGETPITISGLASDTTYDKVQVAFAGSYNKADVPSFKTKLGRNYILNSSGMNATDVLRPTLIGNGSQVANASISYTPESIVVKNKASSTQYGWYYALSQNGVTLTNSPIVPGKTYTLSLKVRGSMSQVALRWGSTIGASNSEVKYYNISDKWTKIYTTLTLIEGAKDVFLRIMGAVNNQYLSGFTGNESFEFKEVKLELGNVPTDWTPAPEDAIN